MLTKMLGIIRAPFLLLVPACIAPAIAVAWRANGFVDLLTLGAVLVAALASQIAVNTLNEYEDFHSGLDFLTERTPFSGGSGTLVTHTDFAPMALYTGLSALLVVLFIGGYFVVQFGLVVLIPGLLGLSLIVSYSRWINRFPLLCLFAPGLGFGVLMVNLAALVLTGYFRVEALVVSLPVSLMVSNLLLLNQFPDIKADRQVGRKQAAIAWGEPKAVKIFIAFSMLCYLSIALAVFQQLLPATSLLAWATLPVAIFVSKGIWLYGTKGVQPLTVLMGLNVFVTLITPVLLAVGIVLG